MVTVDPKTRPRRARVDVSTPQIRGAVKWFNSGQGFGFIEKPDGFDKDVFVHISNLPEGIDTLNPGQVVTFQTEKTPKGHRAVNILLAGAEV